MGVRWLTFFDDAYQKPGDEAEGQRHGSVQSSFHTPKPLDLQTAEDLDRSGT